MISRHELEEAIAECNGQRNPNANTCLKLASFYTIMDHLDKESATPVEYSGGYSYDAPVYESGTEFGRAIRGKGQHEVLEAIDELMETLRVFQPKLYSAFINKITAL